MSKTAGLGWTRTFECGLRWLLLSVMFTKYYLYISSLVTLLIVCTGQKPVKTSKWAQKWKLFPSSRPVDVQGNIYNNLSCWKPLWILFSAKMKSTTRIISWYFFGLFFFALHYLRWLNLLSDGVVILWWGLAWGDGRGLTLIRLISQHKRLYEYYLKLLLWLSKRFISFKLLNLINKMFFTSLNSFSVTRKLSNKSLN